MKDASEHVQYLWQDEIADPLGPVERLVYRSNKRGEDLALLPGSRVAIAAVIDPVLRAAPLETGGHGWSANGDAAHSGA